MNGSASPCFSEKIKNPTQWFETSFIFICYLSVVSKTIIMLPPSQRQRFRELTEHVMNTSLQCCKNLSVYIPVSHDAKPQKGERRAIILLSALRSCTQH